MRSLRAQLFMCGLFVAAGCSGGSSSPATGSGGATNAGSGGNATGGSSVATGGSGTGGQAAGSGGSGGSGSGGTSTGSGGTGAGTGGASSSGGSAGAVVGSGGSSAGGTGGAAAAAGGAGGAAALGACTLPMGAKFSDVESAYAKFKTDLLTRDGAGGFMRVKRPNSTGAVNTSNSEGIAYGMLIAVYMNDQAVFDDLWKYEQAHLGRNGLMDWEINPEGTGPTTPNGTGAATDGDEDMAFALVMADKKWSGKGTLADSYLNFAKKQIDLIWQFEVDHSRGDVLTPGDQFSGGQVINISYFAPAFYRVFGQVSGKSADWNKVVDSSYKALAAALNASNKNASNGLVPAWSTPDGVPMAPPNTNYPTNHQLDSSRTPFRIGQDYCWNSEPRALTYLQKINGFYSGVGAANIVDAYNLDGTPASGATLHLAAFVGPAGVGAMATAQHATLRNEAYAALVTPPGLLGGSLYYNESWTVMSLLMLNGRMVP